MDEQFLTPGDYLAILKRRKWQLIVPAVLFATIAVVVAQTLPAVYRSTATILIEQQEIPLDLIRTTVTSFADQRIQVISQRVMTTSNLGDIIEKYGLFPGIRRKQSLNTAVAEMRKNTDLEMISADVIDPRSGQAQKATIAFSLSFDDPSAVLTQKVTNDLVSLFLNENLRQREAAVNEASDFLREEVGKLADQIRSLESALAKFKEEHSNNLPELLSLNRELMARTEGELRNNAQAMRTLNEQQLYLETELDQLDWRLSLGTSARAQNLLSPEAQLREIEARYVSVAARYSPMHPDRIQMERELATLRKKVASSDTTGLRHRLTELNGVLAAARERYSPNHPDVQRLERNVAVVEKQIAQARQRGGGVGDGEETAEHPAYVQLKSRLETTKLEIQRAQEEQQELEALLAVYEQRLIEGPNIEREYRNLSRDYDNAMSKYREVKDKQMEAELAKALESERKGERFTLVEPPLVPEKPEKPNRPAIMVLGLVLSFAGGFGNLAIREVMDKGVCGVRAVQMITHAPPVGRDPVHPDTGGSSPTCPKDRDRSRSGCRLDGHGSGCGSFFCHAVGSALVHAAAQIGSLYFARLTLRLFRRPVGILAY